MSIEKYTLSQNKPAAAVFRSYIVELVCGHLLWRLERVGRRGAGGGSCAVSQLPLLTAALHHQKG